MGNSRRMANGPSGWRRSYSRRDFLKLGGAGLAGATLLGTAACGGGGGDGGNITFAYGPTGEEDLRTVRQLVERFNEQNEQGITVEFERRSEVTDEYFRSLVSDFRAGSASMDVIAGDVIWSAQFAQNGWIEDLSGRMYSDYPEQVPDAFLSAPISSVSYRNSLWGVPWFTDVGVLYYRQDLLEEAGLGDAPTTWSGLKEIANQVKEEAGTQYGFVFQGGNYEGGVVNGLEYIWNAGGSVLEGNISTSAPGTPVDLSSNFVSIDSQASIQGLTTERSMITDDVAPSEVAQFTETDSNDAFNSGDAVFYRSWPFAYATFGAGDSQISQDQVGVAPLPTEDEGQKSWSCLGGWNMYMNAGSNNKSAAWEFIKWMTNPQQQKFRAIQGSFLPTLRSLYDDQEILNQAPVIDLAGDIVSEDARSRPVTPYYSEISSRLAGGFHESLTGEDNPQQVVQTLSQEMQNIIEQRG
ncbi:MAG: extracellular solute-binding protein [Rubrobacteraceae bacterium]